MTEEKRLALDPRYITEEKFKEHCAECREAAEDRRNLIVNSTIVRFERIEKDAQKDEADLDSYKILINGKFDRILNKFDGMKNALIGLLVAICMSVIGQLYLQHISNSKADDKFRVLIEGKAYHQNISQENNNELSVIQRRINDIDSDVKSIKKKTGKEMNP